MRRLIVAAVVAAVLAAVTWSLWPQAIDVETALVVHRDITLTVEDEGKTRVREVFVVSAPISGELVRVALHPGDLVKAKDTVVASIRPAAPGLLDVRSTRIAEVSVEAATAAVELAVAQLHQAEAQFAYAQSEVNRIKPLARKGLVADRTYARAVLDETTAKTEIERANANVAVQRQQLESARATLIQSGSKNTGPCCVDVKSPVSGRILRVLNESEQVVQAGTPLMEIGDPSDLEVTVELLSRDAVRIAKGAAAIIDGWGGPMLHAVVTRIDPAAVTKISALGLEEQRVTAVLQLRDKPEAFERLGHGFHVVAKIEIWQGKNVLAVPISALFRSGEAWAVFVAADGRARLRTIELGQRNADAAEVTSGLQSGDAVIVHPADTLSDGTRIAILQR